LELLDFDFVSDKLWLTMTAVYGDEVTRPEAVGIVHCGYTTRIHLHLSLLYYFTEANDIYTLIWGDQSM